MIGITGATGALSAIVIQDLLSSTTPNPTPIRLLARDTDKARSALPSSAGSRVVDVKSISYLSADSASTTESLRGVSTLFLVSAKESPTRVQEHQTVIDAAKAAGVKHIVYTSFYHASAEAVFLLGRDHFHTEQAIKQSGLKWTFLRNNFYQDILPWFVTDGVLAGPGGSGKVSAISRKDIADVAALVLESPTDHEGQAYELTGPEDLSCQELADILGVKYVDETMEQARESRKGSGAPAEMIEAWISTYTSIKVGEVAGVSGVVEKLLGRPSATFVETLRASKQ